MIAHALLDERVQPVQRGDADTVLGVLRERGRKRTSFRRVRLLPARSDCTVRRDTSWRIASMMVYLDDYDIVATYGAEYRGIRSGCPRGRITSPR